MTAPQQAQRVAQLEAAAAETYEDLAERAVPALAASLGASFGCMYERRGSGLVGHVAASQPNLFSLYSLEFLRDDPVQEIKRHLKAPVAVTTELISRRALRRSAAYHHVYRAVDGEHAMVARLAGGSFVEDRAAILLLFRNLAQGTWLDSERDALEQTLPFLRVAVQRIRSYRGLTQRTQGLEAFLEDQVRATVVVFDHHGRSLWCSPRAAVLFGGEEDPAFGQMQMHARQVAAGLAVESSAAPQLQHGLVDRCGVPCMVTYQRLVRGDRSYIVARAQRSVSALSTLFARERGLTPAEMRLLEALNDGLSNAEIGLRMQISVPTVRAHLRSIFRKLDVESRLQAVVELRNFLQDDGA